MSAPIKTYEAGEIRLDDDGALDEVVATNPQHFHLEKLDEGLWWMRIVLQDGSAIVVTLASNRSSRTKVKGLAERESA